MDHLSRLTLSALALTALETPPLRQFTIRNVGRAIPFMATPDRRSIRSAITKAIIVSELPMGSAPSGQFPLAAILVLL